MGGTGAAGAMGGTGATGTMGAIGFDTGGRGAAFGKNPFGCPDLPKRAFATCSGNSLPSGGGVNVGHSSVAGCGAGEGGCWGSGVDNGEPQCSQNRPRGTRVKQCGHFVVSTIRFVSAQCCMIVGVGDGMTDTGLGRMTDWSAMS